MSKYRIIKHQYPNGNIEYEVQKKILGFFWWNFNNIDETTGFYSTLDEAKMAIKMDDEKYHIKTIINIKSMDYRYTRIWKINDRLIVADTIEEAIGLYKTYQSTGITNIQAIGNNQIPENFNALIKE